VNRASIAGARVVGERSRQSNHFERLARAEKVVRLVRVIDQHARDLDIDPIANAAAVLRSVVDLLDERGWAGTADEAKCKAPSADTICEVRRVYEQRAEQVEKDPFARFS
jgi:hypothetical protein